MSTQADSFLDDVSRKIKEERHKLILDLQAEITVRKNRSYLDKTEEILIEKESPRRKSCLIGRTRTNKPVLLGGAKELIGKLVKVKIIETGQHFLQAKVCGKRR